MNEVRDRIVEFVSREGPVLPAQISRTFNIDLLFSGALLSELVSKNKIKITNVKRGSSPYYYVAGQEEKLDLLGENLSGKPKEAYLLIKNRKLIRDYTAEPWQRVALREIKDYAVPLQVEINEQVEIFWKWYLTPNSEVQGLLENLLKEEVSQTIQEPEVKKEEVEVKPVEKQVKEEKQLELLNRNKVEQEILIENNVNVVASEVSSFFESVKIYVISKENVRKDKETNYVVDLPSTIGKLRYFVKYKDKKTIADKDLSQASKEADSRNLPLIFLSKGSLTKAAEKYLHKNQSGKIIFQQLN